MCKSLKETFESKKDALVALKRIQKRNKRKGKKYPHRVYVCPFCQLWHLTSEKVWKS